MIPLVLLLLSLSNATLSNTLSNVMLQLQTSGSFEDVYDLLVELQDLNSQEQQDADARNITEEAECRDTHQTLSDSLANALDEKVRADQNVTDLQEQIKDNNDTINYLEKKVAENEELLDRLKDQRCEENEAFIEQLMEHNEALDIIRLLRQDLRDYFNGEYVDLMETSETLMSYSHLFAGDDAALTELLQKIDEELYSESYDYTTKTEHVDNDQDGLTTADTSDVSGKDHTATVEDDMYALIDKLEASLIASIADLEDKEIKTSRDYAKYRQQLLSESEQMNEEIQERKSAHFELNEELKSAINAKSEAERVYNDILRTLNDMKDECEHKRRYYANETQRREEEDASIAEAIRLFETEVPEISDYVKTRGEGDYSTKVTRRTSGYSHSRGNYQEAGGYTSS
jgi:chromosome segregation ATPase